MDITSYLMAAMLFLSPLHRHFYKKETPINRLSRYSSIVSDIVEVTQDPAEEPVFKGPLGRQRTALLLLSMARHESDFDLEVDNGTLRGKLGEVCILQIVPNMVGTQYNFPVEYLLDRKNCIRAALHMVRGSRCSDNINTMLRSYVSGQCAKIDDPKKEKKIAAAAAGEAAGYREFTRRFPMKRFLE